MALRDPTFLLDISVELSNAFTDEYEVTAKSENLFDVYLINTKNNNKSLKNKNESRSAQRKTKKEIPIRGNKYANKQYGRSILLTKTARETILDMKIHYLELYIKSKTDQNGGMGTIYIPWTKSFISYLKNITIHPRLSPVVHKEKLNVVNEKKKISLGSLNVTIKLISLTSNFYTFISSTKNNIRIYRSLFSNPKVLEKENSKIKKNRRDTTVKDDIPVLMPSNNRSDTTYNIIECAENNTSLPVIKTFIESTKDEKNISLENFSKNSGIIENLDIKYELEPAKEKEWNEYDKDLDASFRDKTYCINYFTLSKNTTNLQPETVYAADSLDKSASPMKTIIFQSNQDKPAVTALPVLNVTPGPIPCTQGDLSEIEVISCNDIACYTKMRHAKAPVYDNSLALDLSNLFNECCSTYPQKGTANLKFEDHPCYCTCECKFEIIRETTYCKICGGYEIIGEEFVDTRGQEMPMPCPIFHKLVEKSKLKSRSSSGSLRKRKGDGSSRSIKSSKSSKSSKSTKSSTPKTSEKRVKLPEKKTTVVQPQPEKKTKKQKVVKLKQIDYSYKTPHAGHGGCNNLCSGKAGLGCNVPKSMGWFWTSDEVHGMKYRPGWRPGAAEKHVVHLLQTARYPKQTISKKRKKELAKGKRPLKRPLLVVHKKDGEFTVTMETMKTSLKPREIYEHPYEDKPLLTYTIGRTEEENKERQKQKLRKQRRLERDQRTYLQSAFKNMCQEICLKTCQQALGILPEEEDREGLCYPNTQWAEAENPNPSCACSDNSLSASDTDSDEWILEFTPPNALFDPSRKVKKIVKIDKETQYVLPTEQDKNSKPDESAKDKKQ